MGTPSGMYQLPRATLFSPSLHTIQYSILLSLELAACRWKSFISVRFFNITHLFLNPPSISCIPVNAVSNTKNSTSIMTSTKVLKERTIVSTMIRKPRKAAIGRRALMTRKECSPDRLLISGSNDSQLQEHSLLNSFLWSFYFPGCCVVPY